MLLHLRARVLCVARVCQHTVQTGWADAALEGGWELGCGGVCQHALSPDVQPRGCVLFRRGMSAWRDRRSGSRCCRVGVLSRIGSLRPVPHTHHLMGRPCRRTRLERQLQREALSEAERGGLLAELERRERDITRLQRQRLCAEDFEPLTIIGRGAFGEVARAQHAPRSLSRQLSPAAWMCQCRWTVVQGLAGVSTKEVLCTTRPLYVFDRRTRRRRRCGCAASARRATSLP